MANTPNLSIPYLDVNQAQKEVTHNDALNVIDALLQSSVTDIRNDPPSSPAEGDSYIVGTVPTGVWVGNSNAIVVYYSGWKFYSPRVGWITYDQNQDKLITFDGSAWTDLGDGTSGPVLTSDGTELLPSFAFTNDLDTGLYKIGADHLGFSTNGTLRFEIDPTGVMRAKAGTLFLGVDSASVAATTGYLQLKSPDGGIRMHFGKVGTDNRVIVDLQSTGTGASFVIRDSASAQALKVLANGNVTDANDDQILTSRQTGWTAPTGTDSRAGFDTTTVTTSELAKRVKAIIDDLTTHGLIGS